MSNWKAFSDPEYRRDGWEAVGPVACKSHDTYVAMDSEGVPRHKGYGSLCDIVPAPLPMRDISGGAQNQEEAPEPKSLGEISTRELLLELQLRGDLAMTVMPGSDRGADGAVLSALAIAVLKSSAATTLEAVRGR